MSATIGLVHRLRNRLFGTPAPVGTVDHVLEHELGRHPGGEIGARHLPTQTFETVVDIRADPIQATQAFADAIGRLGRLLERSQHESEGAVSGVIGGGFLNMNPAVVEVRIVPSDERRSRATLTSGAKEGRIKQRTGEKAILRVLATSEVARLRWPEGS